MKERLHRWDFRRKAERLARQFLKQGPDNSPGRIRSLQRLRADVRPRALYAMFYAEQFVDRDLRATGKEWVPPTFRVQSEGMRY